MLLNLINNKDILLFLSVIALIVISIMMVYLVYSQNIQLNKQLDKKDNKKEIDELRELSKELEHINRNNNINMTKYEEEQEQKAIISYDELIKNKNRVSIGYENEELVNNVEIKKIDLDRTGEIELDPIKQELNSKVTLVSYEHEEEFLASLKKLQYLLTK